MDHQYEIIFHPEAEKEYAEALDWYDKGGEGLRQRLRHCISVQLSYLSKSPEIYAVKKRGYRECPVTVFPYVLVFMIYPKENIVYIYSVFHSSRHPAPKYTRKKPH
ncbi:type II toxin-antitoxin system RelE/ParE family toxin [Mucilaginibacter sp. ZT4R22]|uniref:Type II toxin-antitoxin system RelE/ParE family toxin n=1 Tax=Mucilaginibacter pankratovii TaxID=2772110 RepID=A0ABR7WP14_9SPHI|nr:type II toxin-antitoxin system RelE/ParE family toxin [Mucilaginibacter pankratovii]